MPYQKTITRGSVSILVSRIEKGGKAGSYRVQGRKDGKHYVFGVYKDEKVAISKAGEIALRQSQNDDVLASLTDTQKEVCRAVVKRGITLEQVERMGARMVDESTATLQEVSNKWLEYRLARHDFSLPHKRELKYVVNNMPPAVGSSRRFWEIETKEIDAWLVSLGVGSKRFKNIRGNLSSLWQWAVSQGYATENIVAAIETPKIKQKRGGHEVITPRQFATLLCNVSDLFTPWLSISGFAGLRASEICGSDGARLDRLKWEDFDWKRKLIIVRPETSKTSRDRHVPICPALESWLKPWKNASGFVHTTRYPNNPMRRGEDSETQRLGKLIADSWPNNCLRASRASYRVALTGDIAAVALEGGHSSNTLRKEYLNTRFKDDAELWFSLTPSKARDVVAGLDAVKFK